MKAFRLLLWVLGLAALGALIYSVLADDPGYLLIEWRGYSLEATLVTALGLLLATWVLFRLMLALLLWPLRAWRRHGERSARRRLADGLRALQRGEHALALKLCSRAARRERLRVPALVAAVQAARALGDDSSADALLLQLDAADAEAARQARAEGLLQTGQIGAARSLLHEAVEPLSPALRRLRIEAALRDAEPSAAATDLRVLKPALTASVYAELEQRVQIALLSHSSDLSLLRQRFAELPKSARSEAGVVTAFCHAARALGGASDADDALEHVLRRSWHESLAADYGRAAEAPQRDRIRRVEAWLEERPDSPALQLALGRLCRIDGLWGKAESHLLRASHGPYAAAAWEELGLALSAQGEDARARQALQNALASARGQASTALAPRQRALRGGESQAIERRSSMGVPLLADGSAPEAP
jgi:HemY protein